MKTRIAIIASFLATQIIALAGPLDGVWVNTDPDTGSIPRIEISSTPEGAAELIWWGKTHPKDSKYGPLKLTMLGDSAGDKTPNRYGYATGDYGFSDNVFFLRRDGDLIVLEALTVFKDKSGRSNYNKTLRFKRPPEQQGANKPPEGTR